MKKSLIALAALAVVSAASAQTSGLTISGYIDRGYVNADNTNTQASSKLIGSNAGTTAIFFKGTEDLGGGNTAGFSVENDFAPLDGNTQASSYSAAQNAGFANGESFASLANVNLGTLKLGAPNSFMLGVATGIAAPSLSTGVGSAYSSSFSIFNGIGTGSTGNGGVAVKATNGTGVTSAANTTAAGIGAPQYTVGQVLGTAGAREIRINNTIQYVSPMFSGFSAGFSYTPQNNNVPTANNSGTGNTVGVNEYVLNYANGPVKVAFDSVKYTVGSNGTGQTTGVTTNTVAAASVTLAGGLTSTHNLLAASYAVLPELTVNVGFGSFSSSDNLSKGNSTQAGATYVIGAVDLLAVYAKVNDSSASNIDRKMFGLGANYNFSKTARAYVRYDSINYASNQAAYVGSELKRTAVGFSKAF